MQNVILLHGALGFSGDLSPLATSLKAHHFNTHSFSFSGHGNTAFGTKFGISQFAIELRTFIEEKQFKNVSVFGYSMGGFVALQLASEQANLIQNIITLGTKFNWSNESVEKETRLLNPDKTLEKVPAFAKVLEEKHGPQWKELMLKTAAMMREINELELLNAEQLKKINIPVLLGLADKDQMISLEETTTVFKTLSNAAMYMLPNSKHSMETINTDLLAKLIVDFISSK